MLGSTETLNSWQLMKKKSSSGEAKLSHSEMVLRRVTTDRKKWNWIKNKQANALRYAGFGHEEDSHVFCYRKKVMGILVWLHRNRVWR